MDRSFTGHIITPKVNGALMYLGLVSWLAGARG